MKRIGTRHIRRTTCAKNICLALLLAVCGQGPEASGQNAASPRDSGITRSATRPAIDNTSFQAGLRALRDNLPDAAINHFEKAVKAGKSKNEPWSQEELTILQQFLAEAYARAGKSSEALTLYSHLPQTSANNYWTAIALIRQGTYTRGLHWLNQIPSGDREWNQYALEAKAFVADSLNDHKLLEDSLRQLVSTADAAGSLRARVLLANCLLMQDKHDQARQAIQPLIDQPRPNEETDNSGNHTLAQKLSELRPYITLIHARLLAAERNWNEAILLARQLSESKDAPVKIRDLARLTQITIELQREKQQALHQAQTSAAPPASSAEDQLISFISSRPDSTLLPNAFYILIEEKTFLNNPQALEELVSWSNQANNNRQPLASYALAETYFQKNEPERALDVARKSLARTPENPATRKLVLQTVNKLITDQKYDEASELIQTYPHKEAEIYFSTGIIAYEQKEYAKAAEAFDKAIAMAGDYMIRQAYYNANLNALALGDETRLSSLIKNSYLLPGLQERLAYEQAHYAAQKFELTAIEKLEKFISWYSSSDFKAKAMLDLAELALNIAPPRLELARGQIAQLRQMDLTEDEQVRLACLQILVPESQENWPDAIAAARDALGKYPRSRRAPAIRLKLGELLFKNENFNDALLLLQSFPDTYPQSDLKDEALFLAGKAAQQTNTEAMRQKSLDIFRQIADSESPFAESATIEIAYIQRLSNPHETISTLQALLGRKLSRQKRLLAMSIQAEAWSSWASMKDDEKDTALVNARNLCTQILDTPNLRPSWRFSALSQRAQYAEKAGMIDQALDDYYAIISYFTNIKSLTRRDWYWYYDAGFAALSIHEMKQEWDKALTLAGTMAQTDGPRARDAAIRARRIQLEHFIWDDSGSGDKQFSQLEGRFFQEQPASQPAADNPGQPEQVDQPQAQ